MYEIFLNNMLPLFSAAGFVFHQNLPQSAKQERTKENERKRNNQRWLAHQQMDPCSNPRTAVTLQYRYCLLLVHLQPGNR